MLKPGIPAQSARLLRRLWENVARAAVAGMQNDDAYRLGIKDGVLENGP